jgi:hypothetical protein
MSEHPEVMEHVETLKAIREQEDGVFRTADEVEGLVLAEVRKMGLETMTAWAGRAEARSAERYQERHPASHCVKKKPWNGGASGERSELPSEPGERPSAPTSGSSRRR